VDDLLHLVLVAAALLHELGGVLDAGLFVDGSTDGSILAPAERTDTVKKIIIIETVAGFKVNGRHSLRQAAVHAHTGKRRTRSTVR
jgi:hypothetical protein